MQAIDRTAPILPLLPTTPARMIHDYIRDDTTSLFAAFDIGQWLGDRAALPPPTASLP